MEIISEEPIQKTENLVSAEEQNIAFRAKLQLHAAAFEKIVNNLPNTESAVLFCGAIEKLAGDFKDIFLDAFKNELKSKGLSNSQTKRALIRIESDAQSLMHAKHTPPPAA